LKSIQKNPIKNNFNFNDITIIFIIFSIAYSNWRLLQFTLDSNMISYYLDYSPNAYRLTNFLMYYLSTITPLSFVTWNMFQFFIILTAIYFIIKPEDKDYLLFILWIVNFPIFNDISQMFFLMIIVLYRDKKFIPILLIILAPIKEIGAFLGAIYLLLYRKDKKFVLIFCIAGLLLYLIIRFLIIGNLPYNEEISKFFTLPNLFSKLTTNFLDSIMRLLPTIILMTITYDFYIKDSLLLKQLFIIIFIPIFLFAVFWEAQLWFPYFIIALTHKLKEKKQNVE